MKKNIFLPLVFLIASSFTIIHAQTFSGSTGPISDDGQVNDFTGLVSGLSPSLLDSSFGLVTVCIDITHTYDSDLNIHLVAPDGTEINLISGLGGGDDNFTGTCLDQGAGQSIVTGNAPFTGTFRPQETLGNMNNGQAGDGVWILRILDTYPFADAGTVNSWSLTFGLNPATPFVFTHSNLPLLIISTNGVPIPDEPKINGYMGIIDNGPGVTNYITDPFNDYAGNIGIEKRGAYSQSLPQKPYNFETRDSSGTAQNVSLLGLPPEHDFCLIANYNDKVFMRNVLAYQLFENMGHYATRTRFCEVMLNGSYQGIYILCEKIKRDANRIPIAKLDTMDNTGLAVTGGYVIKIDYWDAFNSWQSNYHPIDHQNVNVHFVYHYPKPAVITFPQKAYIQDFIHDFETVLYGNNFAHPVNGYRQYLDISSFIDYLIVNELSRNNDGFKKSRYFYKDQDTPFQTGKLHAGPVWDFDWAWKNIWGCSIFEATDGSGWAHHINDCFTDVNGPGWYVRLFQDSTFCNDLRCRWDQLRGSILDTAALHHYIDSVAMVLDTAQVRHFQKWGNLGVNTGTPEVEPDPLTFDLQITQFKNWIDSRITWLDANIPGNSNGCGPAAIPEQKEHVPEITVFPNPADEFVTVEIKTWNKGSHLEIYNTGGQKISAIHLKNQHTIINLQELQAGFYILKLKNESGVSTVAGKLAVIR